MFVWTDPADITWQANLMDIAYLSMFALAVGNSVRHWRAGGRLDAVVLASAFVYGLTLELSGMIWHDSYVQGDFALMLDFGWAPGLETATLMPSYVPIFYPVMLYTGFKIVERLGITSLWRRCLTGGMMALALDAPYIIEGGLRHVVWWTWDEWIVMDTNIYELWNGWPAMDAWWQTTWHAMFFFLVLTIGQRARWWTPLTIGVGLNLIGPVLHVPLMIVAFTGGTQWWGVAALALVVTVIGLDSVRQSRPLTPEPAVLALAGIYVLAFGALTVGNIVFEGSLTVYVLVQALGLVVISALAIRPFLAGRAATSEIETADDGVGTPAPTG